MLWCCCLLYNSEKIEGHSCSNSQRKRKWQLFPRHICLQLLDIKQFSQCVISCDVVCVDIAFPFHVPCFPFPLQGYKWRHELKRTVLDSCEFFLYLSKQAGVHKHTHIHTHTTSLIFCSYPICHFKDNEKKNPSCSNSLLWQIIIKRRVLFHLGFWGCWEMALK